MSHAGSSDSSKQPKAPNRSRKTGSAGKKGKVFLEDKSGLLSLIGSVTDSKEEERKDKLSKQRKLNDKAKHKTSPTAGEGDAQAESTQKAKKELSASEKKQRDKRKALVSVR